MTKKKSTKRALISSMLILAMCFTMLAGTTFAWFTDSVSSTNNIIKSGKLDMDVLYYDAGDPANNIAPSWKSLDATTKLFDDDALYEPGYTQVAYIKVANVGDLAFKYKLTANIVSETKGDVGTSREFKLSDYLMFGTVETADVYATREAARQAVEQNARLLKELNVNDAGALYPAPGTATLPSESGIIAVVIYMPETVGNEANYTVSQPKITLGLNVLATQKDYESDAFNDQYDAQTAFTSVATAAALTTAIADAPAGSTIEVTAPITDGTVVINKDITIVGNGKEIDVNITSGNVKLVDVDSKLVKVANSFDGTLEFDGGTLSTADPEHGDDAKAPFSAKAANGTFIFKDMSVTAGATKGIKISQAKEVIVDGCTFNANAMNANVTAGQGQTQYTTRSLSMIDIQEQNPASVGKMKVTIKNCTFIGAPQGKLVGNYADTDTAGAIKLKAEEQGFESVEVSGNTFTDCYRDIAVGVNVLISNNAWVGIKSPAGLTNAMNNVADTSVWKISGNTTNGDATHGFLIASNGTKAISDTVGAEIGGATVYYTYKTAKITAGMTVAQVNDYIEQNA